jgi:hypothetical protein
MEVIFIEGSGDTMVDAEGNGWLAIIELKKILSLII